MADGKVDMEASCVAVKGRPFASALGAAAFDIVQNGTLRTVYRGVPFFKSPFDIAIYLKLLCRLRPRTVIEIGTKFGGSALWFADMLSAQGLHDARVLSVDIAGEASYVDRRISFLKGNANALGEVLPASLLKEAARPFLVIEDSSHRYEDAIAVLNYFHSHLESNDYIVVEDGIVSQLSAEMYRAYEDGPNRAIARFLSEHGKSYEIDVELCDHFGYNVTYNPNGWLRRI